jgi:hypothetical protein
MDFQRVDKAIRLGTLYRRLSSANPARSARRGTERDYSKIEMSGLLGRSRRATPALLLLIETNSFVSYPAY